MKHIAKTISYDDRERIFWTLTSVIALFCLVYIYAICTTTINVAERQKLERSMADISARQGSIEFDYIALKNKIGMDRALALGFQEVKAPIYVSRTQANSLGFASTRR